ncbi:hypothetical protein BOTBODRAFT_266275 [Botryobasidium botryosum FD-172 SS1]|uniref:Uncharacterized protein n=1 Tax=Botryobasidium botryosum (strain FD-172 SS1) TaxID=930990 RepID=A0A067MWV2_BOTB1|nr:hypothetical protein BOTBODRAFT_266275 [Botryobasidium botryosum FD-172 SS1]
MCRMLGHQRQYAAFRFLSCFPLIAVPARSRPTAISSFNYYEGNLLLYALPPSLSLGTIDNLPSEVLVSTCNTPTTYDCATSWLKYWLQQTPTLARADPAWTTST